MRLSRNNDPNTGIQAQILSHTYITHITYTQHILQLINFSYIIKFDK